MRVLVCGGRDYADAAAVRHALDKLHAERGIDCLIEGGATGADRLAREWAEASAVQVCTFHANWKRLGKGAGPIRNANMLRHGRPDGVVAFPGGAGTEDMVTRAEAAGLKVWRPVKV